MIVGIRVLAVLLAAGALGGCATLTASQKQQATDSFVRQQVSETLADVPAPPPATTEVSPPAS